MAMEDGWDPDRAMESLKMERSIATEETEEDLARRLLRENAANAAQSVIYIALNDPNGRVRLTASQYILERTLGKVGDDGPDKEEWVEMLQDAMRDATNNN